MSVQENTDSDTKVFNNVRIYGGIYAAKLLVLLLVAFSIAFWSPNCSSILFSSATFFATVSIDAFLMIINSKSYFFSKQKKMIKMFFSTALFVLLASIVGFCLPIENCMIVINVVCSVIKFAIFPFAILLPILEFLHTLPIND